MPKSLSSDVFFELKFHQNPFSAGAEGAYDAPPDPLVGHPLPIPLSLDALGVSISAPSAPRFPVGPQRCEVCRAHQMVNPARLCTYVSRLNVYNVKNRRLNV